MPKPNKTFEDCLKKVRSWYEKRGYNIVDKCEEKSNAEKKQVKVLQQPTKPRQAKSQLRRHRTHSAKSKASASRASPTLKKLISVYKTIEDKALFLSPVLDLKFQGGKQIYLDEAGNQKITIGEEAYNSLLTFTILTTVLNGKMLVQGPPGSGKTSSARFVGSAFYNLLVDYLKAATVFGHPQQTEEKLIAMYNPVKMIKGEEELIIREVLKCPIKLFDEFNRLPPDVMDVVYELLNSNTATYQGVLIKATPGPFFATANYSDAGNFEISPAIKDRFNICVDIGEMNAYETEKFLRQRVHADKKQIESRVVLDEPITQQDIAKARAAIYSIDFPSDLMSRVAHFKAELDGCDMAGASAERKTKGHLRELRPPALCKDCDHFSKDSTICSKTENGLSTRTLESIFLYAKAVSYFRGNPAVTEDDLKAVIPFATAFKLVPTRAAFELDRRFINDRIALVEKLYEMSSRNYEEIVNTLPEYQDITSLVFSYHTANQKANQKLTRFVKKKEQLEDFIASAGKLDTCAKYPLVVMLKKMYNEGFGK